jgi:hypothetical protein
MLLGEWQHAAKPDGSAIKAKYIHNLKIYSLEGMTWQLWKCDKCESQFSSYSKLRVHKRDVHAY